MPLTQLTKVSEWHSNLTTATPTIQNRYWSREECRTRRAIQTPVSTVKLQPRRCPAWTYERLQIQWLLPSGVTPYRNMASVSTPWHHNHSTSYAFHVGPTASPTILSFPTCCDMMLVPLNYGTCISTTQTETSPMPNPQGNTSTSQSFFSNIRIASRDAPRGSFKSPMVPPVIHLPRRAPEAIRKPLKRELVAYIEQGIIAKVDEPIDWVNLLVCVAKANGTLGCAWNKRSQSSH